MSVEDVLNANVYLQRAMTLTWEEIRILQVHALYSLVVPEVTRVRDLCMIRDWFPKSYLLAIDVCAAEQIVVRHPLRKVLHVTLIWLEWS